MIRIGFIRWLVQVEMKPLANNEVSFCFTLVPQAKRYKSLVPEWTGLRKAIVERETDVEIQRVARIENRWDYRLGWKQMELARSLADELACLAVNYSLRVGIVDFEGLNLAAVKYIVRTAILNCVSTGISDEIERVEFIDLVPDMNAVREERQRAEREREAARQAAWQAHNQDMEARRADEFERMQKAEGAVKISFDLLYGLLNSIERDEAKSKGIVTVKTLAGIFEVPITKHGFVRQYADNGDYVVSHCVVFKDYSIPVGDEALMKIALLKTEPAKLLSVSNKFHENCGKKKIA